MLSIGPGGIPDGNPEAVIVGTPLDGTKNVATALGNIHDDITGVFFFFFFLIHMFVFRQSDYLLHRSEGLVPYASA